MLKKFKVVGMAAIAGLGVASAPAHAAFNCTGTVSRSYVQNNGAVVFRSSWAPDYTQICNIKETWKGITPDVCLTWVAKIDAAVSLSLSVTVRYDGDLTCGTLPIYSGTPSPKYVMLN